MSTPDATDPVASSPVIRGAHLVGSVNLPDAESVFRAVSARLGDRLHRIPDGEVGERFYWIQFQTRRFDSMTGLSRIPVEPYYLREIFDGRPFRLDDGVTADELVFPDLGYADAALDSYATFTRLREEGAIPAGVRFQVSLPTPAAVTGAFIVPEDRAAVEPAYERALLGELDRIVAGIPHEDLAIQWDTAVEFALLEGRIEPWFDDVLGGVIERALRQAAAVPDDVHVGYHLCYGDVEEHHFVQPADAGYLAAVTRGILDGAARPIAWVHLPVPIDRDDDAYFAPLADVDVPTGTELYLGLLHHEDGVEGAGRRARAAATAQPRFGVATECGFGRGPSERTAALLDLHAAVAGAW
ncbi:hypothetical protein P5G50_11555 [Leifsonia sp. F6_8S_P_1B]|uniref:Methionine synthase II (Cobalamin-independent) n=1 Tax=Leifsonia williamsii TaxID=3035919 RepID=A0ABT8KCB2_9MICO|nr:hypothetical protein [Leifsonia williamsii]MDN4615086.1 hypothetical protein [Leifsonia williamsii]